MKGTKNEAIERQLFDWSLGQLRVLDTVLEKAGQGAAAALLRDLLVDWRAYPSRTKYAPEDLRKYASALRKIAAGLRKAKRVAAADHAVQIKSAIEAWIRPA